ncbi:hypothetical protein ACRASQ_16070 [Bacteroides hominis]
MLYLLSVRPDPDVSELFCVEWTPGRGFYVAKKNSDNGIIGKEENDVCN